MKNVNNDYEDALLGIINRAYIEHLIAPSKHKDVDFDSLYELINLMKQDKIRIMRFDDATGGDTH